MKLDTLPFSIPRRQTLGEKYEVLMMAIWLNERGVPKLLEVKWVNEGDDWPYFYARSIDFAEERAQFKGADYPNPKHGTHKGDIFWADLSEIVSIKPYEGA